MKKFIYGVLSLLMVMSLVACGSSKNNDTVKDSNAFFLKQSDGMYALYNTSGKKVSKKTYKSAGDIIMGSTMVSDQGKNYGIVDSDGKVLVKLGKYIDISRIGALYKATDADENTYLLNALGKKIIKLTDKISVNNPDDTTLVVYKDQKAIKLLNELGESISTYKIKKNVNDIVVKADGANQLIMAFYNKKETIFKMKNNSQVTTFKADKPYYITAVNADAEQIILSDNENGSVENPKDKISFKFIEKGDVAFSTGNKYKSLKFDGGNIVAEDELLVNILLDTDGKALLDTSQKEYFDEDTYVTYSKKDATTVEFIDDGNMVKKLDCLGIPASVSTATDGIFILNSIDSAKCGTKAGVSYFYTKDGKKLSDKAFKKINYFDSNKLAIVSEDGSNYYLINQKGKIISAEFTSITKISDDYYVGKEGNILSAFDKSGKVFMTGEYSFIAYVEANGQSYLYAGKSNGAADLYSAKASKIIVTNKKDIKVTSRYIMAEGTPNRYFTLNGEEIIVD